MFRISRSFALCRIRWWTAIVAAIVVMLCQPALAHWADMSVARLEVHRHTTLVTVTFPTVLIGAVDDDRNGVITRAEIQRHQAELRRMMAQYCVLGDGKGTPWRVQKVQLADKPLVPPGQFAPPATHTSLQLLYQRAGAAPGMTLEYRLFLADVPTAHCLATIEIDGDTVNHVFTPADDYLAIGVPSIWPEVGHFMYLGVEHILTGFDHILFLICLLMMSALRGTTQMKEILMDVLKTVTAFTIAHSVTLTLAVLHLVTISERLVECLIALSIAYVAAENLFRKSWSGRWVVTFVFGLVHGLGFATAMQAAQIPTGSLALCLATFNLGVEVGQVLTVLAAFTILYLIRNAPWRLQFCRFVSASVLCVAVVWFVERAIQ